MKKGSIVMYMSLSLVLFSCATTPLPPGSESSVAIAPVDLISISSGYDGRTILSGLMFGIGPVAKLFPEIWQDPQVVNMMSTLSAADMAKGQAAVGDILDRLDAKYPTFFKDFAKNMQSGDQILISQTMNGTSAKLKSTLIDMKLQSQQKGDMNVGSPDCIFLVIAVAIWSVGMLYSFGAVAVAATAVMVKVKVWPDGISPSANLERDMTVNLIANRLVAR